MLTRYRVTGRRAYRGHAPGDEFEARLEEDAEARGLVRGDIEVLERFVPALPRGSFTLPPGWATPRQEG